MPLFEYMGLDQRGRKTSGSIEGPGRRAVTQMLRERGVYATQLIESSATVNSGKKYNFIKRLRCPTGDLAAMTRQLATLLGAGLPLDNALATAQEQTGQPFLSRALASVREDVIQGQSLSQAFSNQGSLFPEVYLNMVQVGESTGAFEQTLHRLADFLENQARTRAKIQAALTYPILMMFVGSGVLAFLFLFVMPKITRMLQEMELPLPWPTLFLIEIVDGLTTWWWLLLLVLVSLILMLRQYRRSKAGRLKTDAMILKMPVLGRLFQLTFTARFSRTLATLLLSGIPLVKALEISKRLLTNSVMSSAIDISIREVQEGGSLAVSLRRAPVFPSMLAQLAAAGEKSGQLEDMLFRVAETYEHQTDLTITTTLSLLEPLMILFMGGVIGFMVLAVLLPIFQASQGFG